MRRLVICLLAIGFLSLTSTTEVNADQFTVKQCSGAGVLHFSGIYSQLGQDYVDVLPGCDSPGSTKLGVYQDRSNRRIGFGNGGQFVWYTSGENEIIGTAIQARMNSKNGMPAKLLGYSPSDSNVPLDSGSDHAGVSSLSRWSDPANPITGVSAQLKCESGSGCENNSDSQKAFLEVTDAEFTARDTRAPAITASGRLKEWGDDYSWHRGGTGYTVTTSDQGSGVSKTYLLVNGSRLDVANASCPGAQLTYATSFNPCPSSFFHPGLVDTAVSPFQEGLNRIRFCAEDYSISASFGTPTCTPEQWVFEDNRAPAAPAALELEGGSDWRSTNRFDLHWTNPTGPGSPIAAAEYSLYDDANNLVSGPTRVAGGAIEDLGPIEVPSPGAYRVSVKLVDSAGNVGQPANATLRFDDGRPSNVAPEEADGWLSSDEFPLRQTIERADPGGPSGVDGYAVAISRTGPGNPCPTGSCDDDDLSIAGGAETRTVTIPDLSEGNHWVSSVAASGAGLASETPKTVELHVDKTDPATTLEGVPTTWVSHPVTLVANATDAASGMDPSPGGDPVTAIEPADGPPYVLPGATARFTIADEGVTVVKYWARDFAGNANDGSFSPDGDRHRPPGLATIRIDTKAPHIAFSNQRNSANPELMTASVSDPDSGVMDGQISYRPAGSKGPFEPLETKLEGGSLIARLPSDDLPNGSYELRATATDKAGNRSLTQLDQSGEPMIVSCPLKAPVLLSAGFLKKNKSVNYLRLRNSKRARVAGRLARAGGEGISNARLIITETFGVGSRTTRRVTTTQTDGTGRFLKRLGKGPNRTVQVAFAGDSVTTKEQSRELHAEVYDRATLKIEPAAILNGGTVRMTGKVTGQGGLAPSRGKLIAIQYFDPSRSKWRPADVIRTSRRGQYSYRYRFRTITSAQRIIFRTASLPEAGWPFLPSTSRPKSVIVYPRTGS